jgi:hypothetical protein
MLNVKLVRPNQVVDILSRVEGTAIQRGEMREKVVVLEPQRAIVYMSKLCKQAIEGRVSTAFIT